MSGSNCDAKIFASCIAVKLDALLDKYISPLQRGYMKDRSIISNVVDVEHHAAVAYCQGYLDTVMLFFDFSAAFPSLSRKFIFKVPERAGLPPPNRFSYHTFI